MDNFNLYAKYYDLLNSDKDYQGETDYIHALIEKYKNFNAINILDLGCGTGIHANHLSKKGYLVDGVDISKQMVDLAKAKFANNLKLQFFESDITNFSNDKSYDVVTSLFHVMSYQNSNGNLMKAIKTAHQHLKTNGLFIFDFWYGPGVLTDRPTNRKKVLEDDQIYVERKATPELLVNDSVVHVNYEINILDKINNERQIIKEKHSMRYMFYQEMKFFLNTAGFEVNVIYDWMTFNAPNIGTWNGVIVSKKQ